MNQSGSPKPPTTGWLPPSYAVRNPESCSNAVGEASKPASAIRAAKMPAAAARPTWNDFAEVPKLAISPPECTAANAIAWLQAVASSLRKLAQAAATAIGPNTPLGCQPRACSDTGEAFHSVAQVS